LIFIFVIKLPEDVCDEPKSVARCCLSLMLFLTVYLLVISVVVNTTGLIQIWEMVTSEIRKFAKKYEERLLHHVNVEAIRLLDDSEL